MGARFGFESPGLIDCYLKGGMGCNSHLGLCGKGIIIYGEARSLYLDNMLLGRAELLRWIWL